MTHCVHCGQLLDDHRHVLERRVEVLHTSDDSLHLTVLAADSEMSFCSADCWAQQQQQAMVKLRIITNFPAYAVVSRCCRCGGPFDRRVAYVAFPIIDMVLDKQPWLTTCNVQSEEEFAVLCQQCVPVQFEYGEEVLEKRDLVSV